MPLVYQARDWQHGTYVGASIGSEITAAAEGKTGSLRYYFLCCVVCVCVCVCVCVEHYKVQTSNFVLKLQTRSICYASFLRLQHG